MHGDGVETVVERDAAGERVVDALLRLDRDDRALAGHFRNTAQLGAIGCNPTQ
jgi:hypothetical protein